MSRTAYMHGAKNPCDIPHRRVKEMRVATGPRNGRIFVFLLECGHMLWRRRRQSYAKPPGAQRCIPCWWAKEGLEDIAGEREGAYLIWQSKTIAAPRCLHHGAELVHRWVVRNGLMVWECPVADCTFNERHVA